jgi:hypothetical protein
MQYKFLFRYLIFIGIPYLVAKRIEKYFWKNASPELKKELNKKLKELPELDRVSEFNKEALTNRGGANPVVLWFVKLVMNDFAIKTAIAGAVGASIWSESADNAARQLAKYGSVIISAPGKRFVHLYKRIQAIDPQHSVDIKEILLENELDNRDKVELLKIKIQSVLKNLKGKKRKQFILFVIATILFSVNGNFVLFAWFMDRLRELIGTDDDAETILEYVIECYRQYNAPIPEELTEILPEEIMKSITNNIN